MNIELQVEKLYNERLRIWIVRHKRHLYFFLPPPPRPLQFLIDLLIVPINKSLYQCPKPEKSILMLEKIIQMVGTKDLLDNCPVEKLYLAPNEYMNIWELSNQTQSNEPK